MTRWNLRRPATSPPSERAGLPFLARAWNERAFRWLTSMPRSTAPEVRSRLIQTVIDRKAAVLVAGFTSCVTGATVTVLTGALWPYVWVLAEAGLIGFRMTHLIRADRNDPVGLERHAVALVWGGLIWCALFGCAAALCMATGEPALAAMAGINIAGGTGAISSRNASMPRYATIAMLLCCVPFGLAAGFSSERGMLVVALLVPLWVAGMVTIMRQNYGVMLRMILAELTTLRLARTDTLTDLPNRIHLDEAFAQLCDAFDRGSPPFVVLCLDLDGFKAVNDRHGHGAGDALLRAAAGRIANAIRDGDTACRVGGDEFVVILPNASPAEAAFVASRIITAIARPFDIGIGETVLIGVSIGSASSAAVGVRPTRLLALADQALYLAKSAGKGVHREHLGIV